MTEEEAEFMDSMVTLINPDCKTCSHYLGGTECEAFEEIPFKIFTGKIHHDKTYPGDGGILYKKGVPQDGDSEEDDDV